MPITRTLSFLPAVFETETNQKFLNTTLDQLVTEPNLTPINGYVGRKFAPGYEGITSYIREPNTVRADYQLEPTTVVKDSTEDAVEFYNSYPELLQQIQFFGGNVADQNKLFSSEYYTYDPQIDYDKFTNFGSYYWLPDGPASVNVTSVTASLSEAYYVYPDNSGNVYNFSGFQTVTNPDIVLVRGGTYTFEVNQTGKAFWIQSDPGLSGKQLDNNNLSSREVLGVTNNGDDVGTITFTVPSSDAQDVYINANVVQNVSFVTNLKFSEIDGQLLSNVAALGGLDSVTASTLIDGKSLIFGTYYTDSADWTSSRSGTIASGSRYGVWDITLTPSGDDFTVEIDPGSSIPTADKVVILSGVSFGNTEWYKNSSGYLSQVPVITAPLDTLYYQDGVVEGQVGVIRLIDTTTETVNVTRDILGRVNYISPNKIIFTNGLKIKFDNSVTPTSYRNNEYYVGGVGTAISLTKVSDLSVFSVVNNANFDPTSRFTAAANASISQSRNEIFINSNVNPISSNIRTAYTPTAYNPYNIIEQDFSFRWPLRGGQNLQGDNTDNLKRPGTIGMTLPGIPLYGPSNQWYIEGSNATTWNYNAPEVKINGQDIYGGAPDSNGVYHYHDSSFISANAWGNVTGFTSNVWTETDGHSKLLGFAADGYPIYGPYGYVDPENAASGVTKMTSSYQSNDTGFYRPSNKTITVIANTTVGSNITVSSTFGLNPGMKITFSSNSSIATPDTYWITQVAGQTAVGPEEFTGGSNVVRLNRDIEIYENTEIQFSFSAGSFIEDYNFQEGSGSLDRFNGRYCVTPDYPMGTYAYFATVDSADNPVYPYFVGQNFYGSLSITDLNQLTTQDYITINRNSRDQNPWSRRNRWFHESVIRATSQYNNTAFTLNADDRAIRPIIEFKPDLQLFNFGKTAKQAVDILDTETTRPFNTVEGVTGITLQGVTIVDGMRLIFAADEDDLTRNKTWVARFVDQDGDPATAEILTLVLEEAYDSTPYLYDTVSVLNGNQNAGKSFWFNGTAFVEGQTKSGVNTAPLFDIFDSDGNSLSDTALYPVANSQLAFNGCKIFSYKQGTGTNDSVLGFPLSYRSINNQGDIEFTNNFDVDTFTYYVNNSDTTKKVNIGFIHQNTSNSAATRFTVWNKAIENTKQYQVIGYEFDGLNNNFIVDVLPAAESSVPNLQVFLNFKKLTATQYTIVRLPNDQLSIRIDSELLKTDSKIDILVYSNSVSKLGYFEIPDNLNYNAQNSVLSYPTLGQVRNHVKQITNNSKTFQGNYPGASNLRDINLQVFPGTILQQSSPITYASMFLSDEKLNFVDSVYNAQQEYTRFKNRFLSIAESSNQINISDPISGVDYIVKQINAIKNNTFPWYYSDMVPYGDDRTILSYTILDQLQSIYEISNFFTLTSLSNKAVIVYLNNIQLINGIDYSFSDTGPSIILSSTLSRSVGDSLKIYEFHNTDGNWIPETPTKLGLYPAYKPEIVTDNTYVTAQTFVIGHDGSRTPVFNDYRDDYLLELEKRIYNNIKVSYEENQIDVWASKPGKFRTNDYSLNDYNKITAGSYLKWAGLNKLDYTTNTSYDDENPFTYNYARALDSDGARLPGSWRACYEYFYDTQRPNTHPWEMLGFTVKPSWWETRYGPSPYTSGNTILWTDLENGYIAEGTRQGYNSTFARPGLSTIIPVDVNGNLLPPLQVLTNNYYRPDLNRNWSVGNYSPTETAWRNSSEFPFAQQIIMALTKPAKYFALGSTVNKYVYNSSQQQYIVEGTNYRLTPTDVLINGDKDTNSNILRNASYINWINDFQVTKGILSKNKLKTFLQDYTVQLAYRMAGFSDKNKLKVLAEQNSPSSINSSVIVPDEDYDLLLGKSTPLAKINYSGLIVTKTASGYEVKGYDLNNPVFQIFAPNTTGKSDVVTVINESVNYYTEFRRYVISIPYGTVFTTLQDVANFAAGYERYLQAQGFTFNYFDEVLGQIRNWQLTIKELLFWAQQGWPVNSVIGLSPIANELNLNLNKTFVDSIENSLFGSRIVNQNFRILNADQYTVSRNQNNFTIKLDKLNVNANQNAYDMIAFFECNLIQYEHVCIFNNQTQFADIIYDPQSGERQYRLKLVGQKTNDWDGSLYAPGFVYNSEAIDLWVQNKDYLKGDLVEFKNFYYSASKNLPGTVEFNYSDWLPVDKNNIKTGLLQNFSFNASQFVDFYDTNKVNIESESDLLGFGLIGYRTRTYLNDFGLDDASQVKFYQGYIKQKGTRKAADALSRVTFDNEENTIELNENWAFRVGSYGALDTNQSVELVLNESYTLNNPTSLEILSDNTVTYSSLYNRPDGLYKSTTIPFSSPFLLTRTDNTPRTDDILTAGYPNIEDVDATIFDLSDTTTLSVNIDILGVGSIIWTAVDFSRDWNIYYVTATNADIIQITNNLNSTVLLTFGTEHNLSINDAIIIQNAQVFSGFYRVKQVVDNFNIVIDVDININGFSSLNLNAPCYKLQSLKFNYAQQITTFTPLSGWTVNSKAWINYNTTSNEWAVYNKTEPWEANIQLPQSQFYDNGRFGSAVKISSDNNSVIVGQPGFNSNVGSIVNYKKSGPDNYAEGTTTTGAASNLVGLGTSLDSKQNKIAVGAPDSGASGEGYVYVYSRDFTGAITKTQVIGASNASTRQFGYSISMSDDYQWLYIGAPETDQVVVYGWDANVEAEVDTLTVPNANVATFSLTFDPAAAELITVTNTTTDFVAYRDYTVSTNSITFTTNAQPDTYVVRQTGPGFREITTLEGTANSKFGFSVASSTEGAQVVIGSPFANVGALESAGNLTVYDRSIEKFIAIDSQTLFGGNRPPISVSKVYVNGELQVEGVDYTIVFSNWIQLSVAPGAGKIVTIETDEFYKIGEYKASDSAEEVEYGYSVDLCPNNCSIYAGAPYYNNNPSQGKFETGVVYRLANQGRIYGNITGTVENPTVNSSDSIRLNDYEVVFLSTDFDSVVTAINDAEIPGITATNANGYLSITSNSTVNFDKLRVLPGVGSALTDLGLNVFVETEIISNPTNFAYDNFGQKVFIDSTTNRLAVGSTEATTIVDTTFDKATLETKFDADSTEFKDPIKSGAVWVLNYLGDSRNNINNPGKFAYAQQIKPDNILNPNFQLVANMKFGSAIDIQNQKMFIGARGDGTIDISNAGTVAVFSNPDNLYGWDVYRSESAKIDLDGIIKSYIYDSTSQLIIENLDYIDPAKGKILGIAEQEITYKVDYDPAVYNLGTLDTVSIDPEYYWSTTKVGQVWWDLSVIRFLDYEQGSVKYRTNNWGRVFPGSSIDVYEWVESSYLPSQYVDNGGDGEPKYPDDSAYASITYYDPQTNLPYQRYFYWVKNKTNVTANQFGRTIPTISIANLIDNPKNSGIAYFAAVRDDSVAVFNILDKLVAENTIFHLSYKTEINNNIIHSEYALLSETGSTASQIPDATYNKIVDSASGVDKFGNPVPDPTLAVQERYGIDIRPRQTVFINNNNAVKSMVEYVNAVFAKNLISQGYDLTLLQGTVLSDNGAGEQIPSSTSGAYNITVNNYDELTYINIVIQPAGYKVLVIEDSTVGGLWTIYTKQSNNTWLLTRVQTYRTSDYWQFVDWYATGFDTSVKPNFTVNSFADLSSLGNVKSGNIIKILNNGQNKWQLIQIFPNVVNTVGLQDGTIEFLDSLWDLPAYGMSYDNDLFDSARFDQNPSLEIRQLLAALKNNIFIDNLSPNFLELFFVFVYYALNEQKSLDWVFKTSLIDVVQKTEGLTQPEIYARDDQEFYREYIEEVKPYHTTIREFIVDYLGYDNWTGYTTDFDLPSYFDTVYQQYRSPTQTLAQDVNALNNLLQYTDWNQTYTYYVDEITIANGGTGYTSAPNVTISGSSISNDAVARALLTNGVVTRIDVLYGGSNYTTTPNITISGGGGSGATAYAQLKNDTTRKVKTTLTYDRLTYNSTVLTWQANTSYTAGQIVSYANVAYEVTADFTSGSTFTGSSLARYEGSRFDNANDRIQSYYVAETGQPGKDFGLLQTGIDYPGVGIEGPLYTDAGGFDIGNFDISPFDALEIDADGTYVISETILDTTITSEYTDTSLGTKPEDILVDGGPYISEQVLDWQANTYFPQGTVIKNNGAYYIGNIGIQTGSTFSMENLMLYPLNPYSAFGPHAPEELIPGRVYDTLDISVYTFNTDPCDASYTTWVNTTAFSVANIQVVNGGLGYDSNVANITVTISGSGGATAQVSSVDANGTITAISVVSAGSGYITVPNVTITGSNTSAATAFPRLSQSNYTTFEYRIFKDMNDNYTYLRIDTGATTTLAQELTLTSNTIVVTDSSVLARPAPYGANPGVIYVNGERITYYQIDDATNTLSQIRRGTHGTGANTHANGSSVIDGSTQQKVPYSDNYTVTGLTGIGTTTAGFGYEFLSNVTYIRSVLWNQNGTDSVVISTEEIPTPNIPANIITTEVTVDISTEGLTPTPGNPCGIWSSNTAQVTFIKDGAA